MIKTFILDCPAQDTHQAKYIQLVGMFDTLGILAQVLSGPPPLIAQLWFTSPDLNYLKARNLF